MVFKGKINRTIDSDSELILSTDYYLHKTIMQSIEAPFKSLEHSDEISFKHGLRAVQLSGYLAGKLGASSKVFNEEEELELKAYLVKEAAKLVDDGVEKDSETFKSMLAYSKICWILKLVEENKSSKTEYKV